ncbi:MAG: RidA family protein [Paracoccaceae bacterium]|nr:RidA family protein [Paracoccaceae bacterium]
MREIVEHPDVPGSTSPVSQGTKGGGFVFVGGQMPRDPETGRIVEGAAAQARLSLKHCISILKAAGSGAEKVMLAIVYVTDLSAKDAINDAFAEVFGDSPPARNLVEVNGIGEDAIVEVGVIALA